MERLDMRFEAAVLGLALLTSPAQAEEQLRPLASSGAWIAMAHSPSMTEPDDVCLLASGGAASMVAFRFGQDHLEFRVADPKWALPAAVKGAVVISAGQVTRTYEIADNSDHSVVTIVPDGDMRDLFAAMDKASFMAVTVGKAAPLRVSLAGSIKATSAFRTCAHIEGAPSQPGSNPFQ